MREKEIKGRSGWLMLILLVALLILSSTVWSRRSKPMRATWLWMDRASDRRHRLPVRVHGHQSNEAKVIQLFGMYKGPSSSRALVGEPVDAPAPGFPSHTQFREQQAEGQRPGWQPYRDRRGGGMEGGGDGEAIFCVDDYEHFVHVQSESAVRSLATTYPYDAHVEGQMSLRMSVMDIAHRMREEIQDRLSKAGVEVIEARITHLAYAPEIASAMLRRQQASAIIAARQKIVEGAVSMVEMALDQLSAKHIVDLDEERKASMVSNLLVVLCSDRDAQPIVNAGTLYQ